MLEVDVDYIAVRQLQSWRDPMHEVVSPSSNAYKAVSSSSGQAGHMNNNPKQDNP